MFRGVDTAASGMIASERRQQILNHNLANAQTPGYKQDVASMRAFPDMLIHRIRDFEQTPGSAPNIARNTPLGVMHTGVYTQEAVPQFGQGPITETGRLTDVAIIDQNLPLNPETDNQGRLFFAVEVEGELRYTRNGQFHVGEDEDGQYVLMNSMGHAVMGFVDGEMQRIVFSEADMGEWLDEDYRIMEDGRIIFNPEDPAAYEDAPQIWLGYTENAEQMQRDGSGLFEWMEDGEAVAPIFVEEVEVADVDEPIGSFYAIQQGAIEQSNVDTAWTMAAMMNMFRQFEANQRVLQAYDQTMELAANDIGSIY